MRPCSDFLYARPSFFEGAARIFDMGGTLIVYNESDATTIADTRAIAMDWYVVGEDIRQAMNAFAHGQE